MNEAKKMKENAFFLPFPLEVVMGNRIVCTKGKKMFLSPLFSVRAKFRCSQSSFQVSCELDRELSSPSIFAKI